MIWSVRQLYHDIADGVRQLAPSRFPYRRFAIAIALGIVGGYLFYRLRLPLPWMLGPMVFCTVAALTKLPVAAPPVIRPPMSVVIGVMLGSGFKPEVIWQLPNWLPTLLGLVAFMAIAGGACVYYFRRFGGFDPVTAFFAGMPGGLVEMVTLGEEKGGDARVIALIHSARVLLVVMTLPFLVQWMGGVSVVGNRASGISIVDTTPAAWMWILVSGFLGVLVGRWLRLPAGQLLGPMVVSALVHLAGLTGTQPPVELVNLAQLVLGVTIGCRFVGTAPATILRVLTLSLGSTVILLTLTFGFAALVARLSVHGVIPLVLAYSPGGLAEMSLIALALQTEVAFVAAHHMVRIFLVMVCAGPVFEAARRLRARS